VAPRQHRKVLIKWGGTAMKKRAALGRYLISDKTW